MSDEKDAAAEKPLDKMTIKELRAIAIETPDITGVHGMNKMELLSGIKKSRGVAVEKVKKSGASLRQLKENIRSFKEKRKAAVEAKDKKRAAIYRRRISRLKKKKRRTA